MAEIRPFTIDVPDEVLTDLQARLTNTRWPDAEVVDDWSQGTPLTYTQELCEYWANGYDWRARETQLNRFDQFITEIDGVDIHFVHVRSPHDDAMPLILSHGWPGSIVEFHKVIEPLTDPTRHGGDVADAFHVVAPSLPGFGWSGKPTEVGWGVEKIALSYLDVVDPGHAAKRVGRPSEAANPMVGPHQFGNEAAADIPRGTEDEHAWLRRVGVVGGHQLR